MKIRFALAIILCSAFAITFVFNHSRRALAQRVKGPALTSAEQALLNEINQARAHPRVYADYLEKMKPLFKDKLYTPSGEEGLQTQEGWIAVEDAINFMRAAKPLGPLTASQGLCLAALAHVKDQSATGATGHKGSDSTFIEERVKPFGMWEGGIGENLTYGNQPAREQLLTWLIDDGFASRGHRNRIMSANYRVAGISCGPHPEFKSMCVVTLAGGFVDAASHTNGASGTTKAGPSAKPNTTIQPKPRKF